MHWQQQQPFYGPNFPNLGLAMGHSMLDCTPRLGSFVSRMLLLRHSDSAATWLHSQQPSEAKADHRQIWLVDMTHTMRLIVCTPPHWHSSDDAMCHLCRLAAQQPCPVRKRFNIDHAERPRLMPGSRVRDEILVGHKDRLSFSSPLEWSVYWRQVRPNRLSGS